MSDPFGLAQLPDPLPIEPVAGPIRDTPEVPGSKSVTNRAIVCAALATGTSRLGGALFADDTEAMLGVLRSLGIPAIPDAHQSSIEITGCAGQVPASPEPIDTRQSGTTSRFALPLLALGSGSYRVTAHPQMLARPMGTTFDALAALGTGVEALGAPGHLPAVVTAGGARSAVLRVAGDTSSQFLSGLLMIGPCLADGLVVELTTELVSRPYVELTIAVMASFGAQVEQPDDRTFVVPSGGYTGTSYAIEPDASAASYPLAAAALCGGSVLVRGLGPDTLQGDVAFAEVLGEMGATVTRDERGTTVEAVAGQLRGGTFDFTHISDTAQTLAAIAPFADAPVTITGIGFIRRKEIDRVAAVAAELRRAGVRVDDDPDGWTIHPGLVAPTTFETYDDHRMAMSFALIGLATPGISIAGPACVAKTFPGYWAMLEHIRAGSSGSGKNRTGR
ncbi:3-phosphoshikimate 1-carboxyvinyltransferase [Aquihabitans daechungensis]|uniref:3-phosphoshikimate 1-carboxyvinyltransferase n=1 Tax=Aquihabitans daechungensis TaxID=1052257 RepID=UPI003B9F2CD7